MTVIVYIAPAPRGSSLAPRPPLPAAVLAARAIAEVFQPPRVVALAHPISWVEVGSASSSTRAFPLLAASLELTRSRPESHVSGRFRVATGSEALNAAVVAAISAADSLGALAAPLPGTAPDTLRIVLGGAVAPPEASARLFRLAVNYFALDEPVRVAEQPPPRHPAPGLDDAIDLRFVVNARGQAIPATIEVLGGQFREMAEEAIRVITASRFIPARRSGCAVPQLVYQRVGFRTAH